MIERDITEKARALWRKYPVLTLTGPRQSDKTTLARHAFPEADIVVKSQGLIDLYEIKAASTFHAGMAANLAKIADFAPDAGHRTVVYAGQTQGVVADARIVNFEDAADTLDA